MALEGKGYFIWQIAKTEDGNPVTIANKAVEAGLSHVLIKIADGIHTYNVDLVTGQDLVGGLEVEVAQPLSDNYRGRYITIQQGTVEMDADMVLWYVRSRKTSNDFARSRRQQEVLRAIFKKMVSLDAIRKVPEFYNTYKENVTTDLTFGDIVQLLPLAARITDTSNIHHYYLGPGQVYDWISPGGGMVLLPNPPAVQEVLRQALNAE